MGPNALVVSSFGLFMVELSDQFGWSRAEISTSLTALIVVIGLCLPLVGRFLDRYGPRKVLLPSMLMLALCLASIPEAVSELWHLVLVFVLIGSLAAGTNSITYMHLLTAWFDKHRGLALGIGMSGMGLGFIYVPLLVQFVIERFGWQAGYYALSGLVLCVATPLVFVGVRDSPADLGLNPDGISGGQAAGKAGADVGLAPAEAVRTGEFWKLVTIFVLMSFVLTGLVAHLVPMLVDRGVQTSRAALVASSMGAAVFAGRIAAGYLCDRFFAPRVAVAFCALSVLGLATLALGAAGPMAFAAAVMAGLCLGAEYDLAAYLVSRYFGLRSFGTICGLLIACILFGSASSPLAYGLWFETAGSYTGILIIAVMLTATAAFVAAVLGPFPDWITGKST
jgi:MFS family permease